MNCKQGDLAMYIGPVEAIRGEIFLVVAPDPLFPGAWLHETRVYGYGKSDSIWDAHLRPIRPDGITESEVRDLYAPDTSKETTQ